MGLAESAAEFFPDAAWQRCIVHWYRNVFSHVPSTKVREIAAMLKAIHAGEDITAARQKAVQVIEKLRGLRLTKAAELVEAAVEGAMEFKIGDCKGELEQLRESGELRWKDVGSLLAGPYLRTIPGVHPCDGFFAAMIERR